jgi:hypothetical protein
VQANTLGVKAQSTRLDRTVLRAHGPSPLCVPCYTPLSKPQFTCTKLVHRVEASGVCPPAQRDQGLLRLPLSESHLHRSGPQGQHAGPAARHPAVEVHQHMRPRRRHAPRRRRVRQVPEIGQLAALAVPAPSRASERVYLARRRALRAQHTLVAGT